jgi:PAS domain S-box-containing protein
LRGAGGGRPAESASDEADSRAKLSVSPPPPAIPSAADLLEALPDAAMLVDAGRHVIALNGRLRGMFGKDEAFRHGPESFAALARRLALAGEYAFIGIGDMIDGGGTAAERDVTAATGATVHVEASRCPDGATLLRFLAPQPAADHGSRESFAIEVLRRLPGTMIRVRLDADDSATCIYAGPRARDVFGLEPNRLMDDARNLLDFIHRSDREAIVAMFRAMRGTPGPIDHEFRIVKTTGATIWTRAIGKSFRAPDGNIYGFMRLIDVGARFALVAERRRLRQLLDMVVDNIPHIVTVRDVRDMSYVLINRAAHDLLGVDISQLLGRADAGIFPADVREIRRPLNQKVVDTGKPLEFPEMIVATPRGPRIFKTTKFPLVDDDGVLRYVLSMNEDVTERRQAQDALRRSEQRLREALESFSDGLALFDGNDRLVLCNRRYRDMWPGHGPVARPGTPFVEMVRAVALSGGLKRPIADIEAHVAEIVNFHQHPPATREFPLADGRWFQVSDRATAEGGIVVTCSDITALKEREDSLRRTGREALRAKEVAENASRSKSDFLAKMSHELRTPLNAVIGFSEIIKDALLGDNPEKSAHYRAYASDIHTSGRHLLSLINDILDMSKIEAGKLELTEERVDVQQCIESSLLLVRERARQSGIALSVAAPANLPSLRADLRKMKQVLINLLSNAVKFTKRDGRVTIEAFVEESGEFVLRVADTGIGIRPEDIDKALEPFGQVDDRLARSYEGTGLGLTLTKSLVELHGGRLEIASRCDEPPTGTTVTAIFPAHRVLPPELAH